MIPARQLIKILQNNTNILTTAKTKQKKLETEYNVFFIEMIKYAYNSDLL